MGEQQLVKRARKGDDEAFYELLQTVKSSLYRTAYRYFGNEHDALDAVQEVTCKAYLKLHNLRKPGHFKPWILRIMMNYCHDEWRRRKRTLPVEEIFSVTSYDEDTDRYLILRDLLLDLDPKMQEIIQLKYFEDWTLSQIAEWKRVPEGTIKTRLNRALKQLRFEWEKGEERHV
ncbi:sigma-70 family RNA polymerase sigma factor [Salinibacillus aidingensis]|uniref:Sigma-70 family RNA polymerase sigma factor n=1 Tax=Salinibacillus aidingensis TaxID=237684 RepID=A0ABN1BBL1_9BACI